jgi:tetratricopeptide (TPR) repeat protein
MLSLISDEIKEIILNARSLENIGRYDEAAKSLSAYWKNTNKRPDVSRLSTAEQAEILLRCGSLAGYVGSCNRKKDAQKLAQTWITEASRLFLLLAEYEKLAECETSLALTYWRLGQLDEARIWVNSAFEHDIDKKCEVRLYTYVVNGIILFEEGKYVELVNKCTMLEPLFRTSKFYILQGDFNNNYAYGLMKTGDKERAVGRFKLARYFYTKTKHYLYLALLENNLAIFYKGEMLYAEAHDFAESARESFKKLGDKTREGYSIDTQAQIYMAEGNFAEALKCANEAIAMLENGENYCYLANSMQTKSHIEFYLKDYVASAETWIASVNIASIHISQTQAKKFIEEYVELLKNCGLR